MDTTLPSVNAKGRFSALLIAPLLLTLIAAVALPATAASGKLIAHNTPSYVSTAKNLGTEDPSKVVEVTVWLNPHNRAGLDTLAQQLYDPASPNYRHFLKSSQIAARFAPTAAEAKTVQQFLEAHNLKTVRVGPNNFFVRARGTVGDVENALHVQLNNYEVRGKVIRSNDRDPYVDGAAAPLVRAISGLNSGEYEHPAMARPTLLRISAQKPCPRTQAGHDGVSRRFLLYQLLRRHRDRIVLDQQRRFVPDRDLQGQSFEPAKPDQRGLRLHSADDSDCLQSDRLVRRRIRRHAARPSGSSTGAVR